MWLIDSITKGNCYHNCIDYTIANHEISVLFIYLCHLPTTGWHDKLIYCKGSTCLSYALAAVDLNTGRHGVHGTGIDLVHSLYSAMYADQNQQAVGSWNHPPWSIVYSGEISPPATQILTYFSWNNPVSAIEWLMWIHLLVPGLLDGPTLFI